MGNPYAMILELLFTAVYHVSFVKVRTETLCVKRAVCK